MHAVNAKFKKGDLVVFRKTKHGVHPSDRAIALKPAQSGEAYSYCIDKYWVVAEVPDDRSIVVETRRGKRHQIEADQPNLRRASLIERLFYRDRFPELNERTGQHAGSQT
ncbi:MAG TPA: hypothetical protein VGN57_19920 [Pirellulaceae bacterium]|jgi:hypothetical protein|nr:hypothetical protein [Pirellulaceae bacterium]